MQVMPDIERKVITIIHNMCSYGRAPTIQKLCIKTGREKESLLPVLNKLEKEKRIRRIGDSEVLPLPLPNWYSWRKQKNIY